MTATTKAQLVSAASSLLDSGGQAAVTLRAVAERVGVSHNAPYRHFRDRSALLAAVAERDFVLLRDTFAEAPRTGHDAGTVLRDACAALVRYARRHPARYRLLFSDPGLPSNPSLREAAFGAFQAFSRIVADGQASGRLPPVDPVALTGVIYAAVHGAIDLALGGRASGAKGLGSIEATVALLLDLLARPASTSGNAAV